MLGMSNGVQNLNVSGSSTEAQNLNITGPPAVLPAPPVKWIVNDSTQQVSSANREPSLPFYNNFQQNSRTHQQNGYNGNMQQPAFNPSYFGNNNNNQHHQDNNRSFFPNNGNYNNGNQQYQNYQKRNNYGPSMQGYHQPMHKNMPGGASAFIPLQAAIKSTKHRNPESVQQKPQKVVAQVSKESPSNVPTSSDSLGGQESHFSSRQNHGQSRNSGSSRKSRLAARFPATE